LSCTKTPEEGPDFQRELLAIREDPTVKSLARRYAGDHDLAEDALAETGYAVGQMDPETIRDLRAYFCTVLIRKARQLRNQLGATSVADPEVAGGARQRSVTPAGTVPSRPFDEVVGTRLMSDVWCRRLAARRERLRAAVPARSTDRERYRDAIVIAAEWVLRGCLAGDDSHADFNEALRAAYPEWFAEPGCRPNTYDQRFSRARADVREVLKAIVIKDELLS
jgi:DNA-directed RNA polymerase specialized sigma24 family protein